MKEFRVFHWDTFDNATILVGERDTLDEAKAFVEKKYKGRIRSTGADQVDIVNRKGDIIEKYPVG